MKKVLTAILVLTLLCSIAAVSAFAVEQMPTEPLPENNTIGQVAHASEGHYRSAPEKEAYAVYNKFGLTYNDDTEKLYYDGKLVRCFDDLTDLEDGSSIGINYYCAEGIVDVSATRKPDGSQPGADGSYDPKGELTGLRLHTDDEFNSRTMEDMDRSANAVSPFTGNPSSPDELAIMYTEYEAFGVTYDKEKDILYFEGQPVRTMVDVLVSNGSSPAGGSFEGSLRTVGSNGGGTIDLYTVRNFSELNRDGYGTLTAIEKYSQEEFEQRTEEIWVVKS